MTAEVMTNRIPTASLIRDMSHDVVDLYTWFLGDGGYVYAGQLRCEHGYALHLLANNPTMLPRSTMKYYDVTVNFHDPEVKTEYMTCE